MIKNECEIIESGKNFLSALNKKGFIPDKWTGKTNIEINSNQGGITEIKVLPELKFK